MRISQGRRWIARLALAVLLLVTGGALVSASAGAQGAASISPDPSAFWRSKAAELRARFAAAAVREQAATAAYSRMLTRRYPAGEAKLAILDEREAAAKALADARTELREFKEEARATGVPDRWIDPEGTPPPWWIDPDS
jgi:hypothetical protein